MLTKLQDPNQAAQWSLVATTETCQHCKVTGSASISHRRCIIPIHVSINILNCCVNRDDEMIASISWTAVWIETMKCATKRITSWRWGTRYTATQTKGGITCYSLVFHHLYSIIPAMESSKESHSRLRLFRVGAESSALKAWFHNARSSRKKKCKPKNEKL